MVDMSLMENMWSHLPAIQVTFGSYLDLSYLQRVCYVTFGRLSDMSHLEAIQVIFGSYIGHIWKLYRSLQTFLILKQCIVSHLEACLVCHVWKLVWFVTFGSFLVVKSLLEAIQVTFGRYLHFCTSRNAVSPLLPTIMNQ